MEKNEKIFYKKLPRKEMKTKKKIRSLQGITLELPLSRCKNRYFYFLSCGMGGQVRPQCICTYLHTLTYDDKIVHPNLSKLLNNIDKWKIDNFSNFCPLFF